MFNKETFVSRYVGEHNATIKEASAVYDSLLRYMREELDAGERVYLKGIGTIYMDTLKAKEYPVPGTDRKVMKGERRVAKLKATAHEI